MIHIKRNTLAFWIFLCFTFAASIVVGNFTANNQSAATQEILEHDSAFYANYVDILLTNTWNRIQEATSITQVDCTNFITEYDLELKEGIKVFQERYSDPNNYISPNLKTLIDEICADFGLDVNTLTIIYSTDEDSPAASDDLTLYINEKNLNTFSPAARRFIIAHEIGHILNRDNTHTSALKNLLDLNNPLHQECIASFAYSIEWRADITALLLNSKYSLGGIECFKQFIALNGDAEHTTHPRTSERLQTAQNIHTMHLNATIQKEQS